MSRRLAILLGAACAALLLLSTSVASASPYPLKLSVAVKKAYAPKRVKMNGPACKKTLGNQLYALVAVFFYKNGRVDTSSGSVIAFQFINTAGWFAMWKDGKVLPAVAKNQRANVKRTVNKLRAKCA